VNLVIELGARVNISSGLACNQLSAADCTSQFGCKVTDIGLY
jgi:hypothetical protein